MSDFTPVPDFAVDYPERAETLDHARLPFYCVNCHRKRPTRYLTPNFGPFCGECLRELFGTVGTTELAFQVLKNSGIDVTCGACMEVAFTSVTTNPHTCPSLPGPLLQCIDCKNTESPAGAMARYFNQGRCLHCGGWFKVVRA